MIAPLPESAASLPAGVRAQLIDALARLLLADLEQHPVEDEPGRRHEGREVTARRTFPPAVWLDVLTHRPPDPPPPEKAADDEHHDEHQPNQRTSTFGRPQSDADQTSINRHQATDRRPA